MTPFAAAVALALSTLASEDLACVAAGALVAHGDLGLGWAVAGCVAGIWGGDFALAIAGRKIGRPLLRRRFFRRLVSEESLRRAERWFARRGDGAMVAARFLPGTRVATYVAAGILGRGLGRVAAILFLGAAIWVPTLVGASAWAAHAGGGALPVWALGLLALAAVVAVRCALSLATWRGRRLLVGRLRRWVRWEFWPRQVFYPPVVAWIATLGVRYRSPLLFTAANPAMPAGGFVGESKSAILAALQAGGAPVARFRKLPASDPPEERLRDARSFASSFPVVLKPDVGERGTRVSIVRDDEALVDYLATAPFDAIVQEYVPGPELGIFYVRRPSEPRGRILSIVEKRLPWVVGDGRSTVERLVLADERAVAMAPVYLARLAPRLDDVPAAGERVALAELGNHCLGSEFVDGERFRSEALERAIDEMSLGYAGFFFGRYDLRAPSEDDLRAGTRLKILELNGVTSEAAHVYDARHGVFYAWRTIAAQWSLAFEIGKENVERGIPPISWRDFRLLLRNP